jgi:RNA polymerase sigma-70 factor (sigma-E family)
MGVIAMGIEWGGQAAEADSVGDVADGPTLSLAAPARSHAGGIGGTGEVVLDLPAWEAYLTAFDEHAPGLLRLAVLLTGGDHHAAEDLVQETFVATFGPWRADRVDNLGGYLRRTLTNRVTSAGRRRVVADRFRARRHGDDRGGRDVGDQATDQVALTTALASLPPKQRAAVVLRFYEGLSVAECADLLGVATGTVKSQTSDALATLRRTMEGAR